jgi:hypothetical protein
MPICLHPNIGLIDAPGAIGWLEFRATAPIQFGSIALDPPPDTGMVCGNAALGEEFLDVTVGE